MTRLHELHGNPSEQTSGLGKPVSLTCPECGGPIRESRDRIGVQFRCQVGHGFSLHAMLVARLQDTEKTLWHLVSNSMEAARLAELLATQSSHERLPMATKTYLHAARISRRQAGQFQQAILDMPDGNLNQIDPVRLILPKARKHGKKSR